MNTGHRPNPNVRGQLSSVPSERNDDEAAKIWAARCREAWLEHGIVIARIGEFDEATMHAVRAHMFLRYGSQK